MVQAGDEKLLCNETTMHYLLSTVIVLLKRVAAFKTSITRFTNIGFFHCHACCTNAPVVTKTTCISLLLLCFICVVSQM